MSAAGPIIFIMVLLTISALVIGLYFSGIIRFPGQECEPTEDEITAADGDGPSGTANTFIVNDFYECVANTCTDGYTPDEFGICLADEVEDLSGVSCDTYTGTDTDFSNVAGYQTDSLGDCTTVICETGFTRTGGVCVANPPSSSNDGDLSGTVCTPDTPITYVRSYWTDEEGNCTNYNCLPGYTPIYSARTCAVDGTVDLSTVADGEECTTTGELASFLPENLITNGVYTWDVANQTCMLTSCDGNYTLYNGQCVNNRIGTSCDDNTVNPQPRVTNASYTIKSVDSNEITTECQFEDCNTPGHIVVNGVCQASSSDASIDTTVSFLTQELEEALSNLQQRITDFGDVYIVFDNTFDNIENRFLTLVETAEDIDLIYSDIRTKYIEIYDILSQYPGYDIYSYSTAYSLLEPFGILTGTGSLDQIDNVFPADINSVNEVSNSILKTIYDYTLQRSTIRVSSNYFEMPGLVSGGSDVSNWPSLFIDMINNCLDVMLTTSVNEVIFIRFYKTDKSLYVIDPSNDSINTYISIDPSEISSMGTGNDDLCKKILNKIIFNSDFVLDIQSNPVLFNFGPDNTCNKRTSQGRGCANVLYYDHGYMGSCSTNIQSYNSLCGMNRNDNTYNYNVWNGMRFDDQPNDLKIVFKKSISSVYFTHNDTYLKDSKVQECLDKESACTNDDHSRHAFVGGSESNYDVSQVYDLGEETDIQQSTNNLDSVKSVILI